MNKKYKKGDNIPFILRRSGLFILIIVIITIVMATFLPRIQIDNEVDAYWDRDSQEYLLFDQWKEQFGNDKLIIIALSTQDVFTHKNLSFISKISDKIEMLDPVKDVNSLSTVNDILGTDEDFIVQKFIQTIPKDKSQLNTLQNKALKNPLYVNNIISKDSKTAGLVVELINYDKDDQSNYLSNVITEINQILSKELPKDIKSYMCGPGPLEYYYSQNIKADLQTFIPCIFLVIMLIVFFSFKDFGSLLLCMASITVVLIWSMFLFYILGFRVTGISSIIPVIILAVVLAYSIHVVTECTQNTAITQTMKHLFTPCLFTAITTAVGFFSLTISKVVPIREVGIVVGVGVILGFVITFTLIPAMVKQFNFRRNEKAKPSLFFSSLYTNAMKNLAMFNNKYKKYILGAFLIIVFIALWGISNIKVDTSTLEFFKKDSKFFKSTEYVEDNLSGVHFLEISLKADKRDHFKDPLVLKKIENLQKFLNKIPEVSKTTSVIEYIKEINKSFHNENEQFYEIPRSRKLVSQYMLLYGATDLNNYIDSEWQWATVEVRLSEHSTNRLDSVIKDIKAYLDKEFPSLSEAKALGIPIMEVASNQTITQGQIQSLALAMILIFSMMFIVFRSIPVGIISIIPNIFPILINFGIMGIIGIRLDSATAMISAIGIGIIVDDTIHFLHCFGQKVNISNDYYDAMLQTLLEKGRPIILTSIILFLGFGVFVFSRFMPTLYFGVLSATMMLVAVLTDLIVLPCLLLVIKPRFYRNGGS